MLPANEVARWYYSREEIENNSPSRLDGIDLEQETLLRKSYCSFLKDLGLKLEVNQVTIVTAMLFCHRFFLRQSHAKNDRLTIATVCMFIASKVESIPLDLKHVIVVSNEIKDKKVIVADQRQEVFEKYKEIVLSGETFVLSTLNFDIDVDLPYEPLIEAIEKYIVDKASQAQFAPVARRFLRDCFWTTLCLQYQARHIAAGAFYLAAMDLKMDLRPYGRGWFQHFDITRSQLDDICGQMHDLYHGKKPIPETKGSTGETSNSGDVVHQTVPTDMASKDKCPSSEIEGSSSNVNLSQSDDRSLQDKSRPEGVEKDSPEREGGDTREDSNVRDPAAETSDDAGVSRLEKNLQPHPEEQ